MASYTKTESCEVTFLMMILTKQIWTADSVPRAIGTIGQWAWHVSLTIALYRVHHRQRRCTALFLLMAIPRVNGKG